MLDRQNSIVALTKSYNLILKLLPIFVVIITLTTVINYFLKPKTILKHFGEDSGIKGWIYATFSGIISHGPLYAWYPLINDLRDSGLKDSLLITFMFSRAIKVPYIPVMIDYFGLLYTVVLTINILIAAILQGLIFEALNKKRD